MRVIVVGLGVQGMKRRAIAQDECVATVDPNVPMADYRFLKDVPVESYDAALLCVPDTEKFLLLSYLIAHRKHVLVEKPLLVGNLARLKALEMSAQTARIVLCTAYNHRFEPHVATVKSLLENGIIGDVYRCSLFYGNGTAELVRRSLWRDREAGVIPDLGSHLLDIVDFWFQRPFKDLRLVSATRYENRAVDHAVFFGSNTLPHLLCEVSLLSWRNTFSADLTGSEGSIHVRSLCKWSESELIIRKRVRPSGLPSEERIVAPQGDPTWALEYENFTNLCRTAVSTDLKRDLKIAEGLEHLARQVGVSG